MSVALRFASAVLIVLSTATCAAAERVTRLDLVDRSIEFHGGELFTASQVKLTACSRSGCAKIVSRVDDGLFEHDVTATVGGAMRRVKIDNDRVEWWVDGERRIPDAEMVGSLRDWAMSKVYFVFLPYRLNDPDVFKEDRGSETWRGRALRRVKVTFRAGSSTDADDEYTYWFDPETGVMVQFAYSYSGDPGGLRFRRLYNYRRLKGLAFHDQENLGVEGEGLSVDQITPAFVAERMRPVSRIEVSDLDVTLLR